MAALHFHHLDGKDSAVSKFTGAYQSKKAWEEIKKCVLLCANCHAEIHNMQAIGLEPMTSVASTQHSTD